MTQLANSKTEHYQSLNIPEIQQIKIDQNNAIQKRYLLNIQTQIEQMNICQKIEQNNTPFNLISQNQAKSPRKFTFLSLYKRASFYSKEKSFIPNLKQAKQRDKQIRYFHKRNFYKKQKHLQDIFRQNCRIYQNLQNQKSSYELNFTKLKKSHSISCTQYSSSKTNALELKQREDAFDNNTFKIERRYSLGKNKSKQKQKMTKIGTQAALFNNIKLRYSKNKTQISQRVGRTNKENVSYQGLSFLKESGQVLQNKKNNKTCIRYRKRPSTAFRC